MRCFRLPLLILGFALNCLGDESSGLYLDEVAAGTQKTCFLQESVHLTARGASSRDKLRQGKTVGSTLSTMHHLSKSESSNLSICMRVLGSLLVVAILHYLGELTRLKLCGDPDTGTNNALKENVDDIQQRDFEVLPEDVNGAVIATLVRDCAYMSHHGMYGLRISRVAFALILLFVSWVLQIGIIIEIKLFVTPPAVFSIRMAYDEYEFLMYGSLENHTVLLKDGTHRGIPKYFQPALFGKLSLDLKKQICSIPFSQLQFTCLILCVWALVIIGQMRNCLETATSLLVVTPAVSTMAQGEALSDYDLTGDGVKDRKIVGLTPLFKAVLLLFVFLPWLGSLGVLLWLGSRWLTATTSWGDVVANAVALEFIVHLKGLLYIAFVSERTKRDVRNTTIPPFLEKEPAGWCVFFGSSVWGLLSILWVFVYIYKVQSVLPEYNWDVHSVCTGWLLSLS